MLYYEIEQERFHEIYFHKCITQNKLLDILTHSHKSTGNIIRPIIPTKLDTYT